MILSNLEKMGSKKEDKFLEKQENELHEPKNIQNNKNIGLVQKLTKKRGDSPVSFFGRFEPASFLTTIEAYHSWANRTQNCFFGSWFWSLHKLTFQLHQSIHSIHPEHQNSRRQLQVHNFSSKHCFLLDFSIT